MAEQTNSLQAPLPPPDLHKRKVPVMEMNLGMIELYRVHRPMRGAIHYNRRSSSKSIFRWDSATDSFGVLYAAPELATCLAETVFREMFQGSIEGLAVDHKTLRERMVSRLGCPDKPILRLADLTHDIYLLGGDGNICTSEQNNYSASNQWSDALHAHPQNFDGISYPSRYAGRTAVAIFDRARLVERASPISLADSPEVDDFLVQRGIFVIPDVHGWREPEA